MIRPIAPSVALLLALTACPAPGGSDDAGSSSEGGSGSASTTDSTTASTTASTSDSTTASSTASTTASTTDATTDTDPGSDSSAGSSEAGSSGGDASSSGSADAGSSSGGPTNDCTNADDPCVLELDVAHAGGGGADQYFVYTVGDGNEQVSFDGIAGDYAAWDDTPWSFLCAVSGPCSLSTGAGPVVEPLQQPDLAFARGDVVYLFVYANADYTVTVLSG
ncbi:MAG: hypothetical protein U0168_31900 [Nannocystaceae bacterium]